MKRSLYIYLVLWITVIPNASCAASFDCGKAGTLQEKMICSDSALSGLDNKLAQSFKSVLAEATATETTKVQAQQIDWLRNVRNACATKPCLAQAYEKRIQQLALRKSELKSNCPVTENALIGSWERVSGGFFEEMSFEQAGEINIFNSWLHQRPEISGATWKIQNRVVLISHPTQQEMKFTLQVVGAQGDKILLRDVSHKSEAVYKRVR